MTLDIDYQTIQKDRRQQITNLLDQFHHISVALKEIHEQKKSLFKQWQIPLEKCTYCEKWKVLPREESTLLHEELAILAQLSSLRERKKVNAPKNFSNL